MSGKVGPDAVVDWGIPEDPASDPAAGVKQGLHGAVDASCTALKPAAKAAIHQSVEGGCGPVGAAIFTPVIDRGVETSARYTAQWTKDTIDSSVDQSVTSSRGWGAWFASWFSSGSS